MATNPRIAKAINGGSREVPAPKSTCGGSRELSAGAKPASPKRIAKNRLLGARRCPWRVNQPVAVRPVVLAANGALSTNEA